MNRVLRNRPAAGHCRGLAESFHLIARRSPFNVVLRRCSATLLGFYPDCPSQLFSSRAGVFHFRGYAPTCRRASRLPRRFRCSPPLSRTRRRYRRARADSFLSSGFWDLAPPASRFRALVRPRLGLGTKGRFDPRTVSALGFSSFGRRVRRTPAHRFRSYPLVGFVFAAVGDFAQCVTCFHHATPPIPPTARRRPSAF